MPPRTHAEPVKKSDFDYELPPELIAQAPLPERSASRLLVVAGDTREDRHVRDLPDLLRAGDLLVFNDTRVIPARLFGRKATGGRVEILVERLLGASAARVQLGVSKSPADGSCTFLQKSLQCAAHAWKSNAYMRVYLQAFLCQNSFHAMWSAQHLEAINET